MRGQRRAGKVPGSASARGATIAIVSNPAGTPLVALEEYVRLEETSDTKHEFLRGEVFAMAGGTPEHARLAAAMIGELRVALRGRPCVVYSSDLRVRIDATDLTTYPDATVVCGRLALSARDPKASTNPLLLVEILSDTTEAYDRGEKFAHYRRLSSLREYVLVSQREPRIEVFRKNELGEWVLGEAVSGQRIRLSSLEIEIAVDDVYRDPLANLA